MLTRLIVLILQYTNIKSVCCTVETNIMLCVNCTSIMEPFILKSDVDSVGLCQVL